MMRVAVAATAVALGVLLGGCSSGAVSVSAGPTASALPVAGSSLSPADFAAAAKLPGTVLLDVRTPEEFGSGHLPGAVNVDVESAAFAQAAASLDKAKTYAVYCRTGNRSKAAMTALQQLGFARLFDLSGGINAWKSAGGEVVTG